MNPRASASSMLRAVISVALLGTALLGPFLNTARAWRAADDLDAGVVSVAMLTYGAERKSSICFSDSFLKLTARETEIKVDRSFRRVALDSEELFDHPFAVMTGEGAFEATDAEVANLRRYLTRGGFLLASAGCSNAAWGASMRRTLLRVFPDSGESELKQLPLDHPVFQTIYDITEFQSKQRERVVRIFGIEVDGRLCVVFSPEGLNDTANAGGGCCCCGGNEIRNAKYINANILAYALMK